jgi:hypothetical protein
MVLAVGCQSPQETRLALPAASVVVSMRANSYRPGDFADYGIDYGSTIPFGKPTVQVLSGTQVVISESVPQHYAVVRKVYQHGVKLMVNDKPLPPGFYGLRVTFGDQQTEVIPFTIRK